MKWKVGGLLWIVAVALFLFASVINVSANDVDLSLDFEQSIGESAWTSRGKVKYVVNKAEKKLSVKFENPTFKLNTVELAKLKAGWLRVRIPVVNTEGAIVPGKFLMTSVKGCALIQDPKEVFSLLTDKTGSLIGLQYERPLITECSDKPLPNELEVASKIIAVLPKEAQSLPMPRIDAEPIQQGEGKQQEQPPAQKSFLQEYWYLILPSIVIYTMLTAPAEPPAAAPAGEPSTAAIAAGSATAAAAAAPAGAQVRRRKGGQ
jgi:hypothetical protein